MERAVQTIITPDKIVQKQTLSDEFLHNAKVIRESQDDHFAPDTVLAASIPFLIFEEYLRSRGLSFADGMEMPVEDIIPWLQANGYDNFVMTKRKL
ncbi:MAG: hypothetical protein HC888_00945 [Candidatus Competibacteraceae bacterium]|nr:hypothetical protein [Candidatus Competibacteraceae bacterium]